MNKTVKNKSISKEPKIHNERGIKTAKNIIFEAHVAAFEDKENVYVIFCTEEGLLIRFPKEAWEDVQNEFMDIKTTEQRKRAEENKGIN